MPVTYDLAVGSARSACTRFHDTLNVGKLDSTWQNMNAMEAAKDPHQTKQFAKQKASPPYANKLRHTTPPRILVPAYLCGIPPIPPAVPFRDPMPLHRMSHWINAIGAYIHPKR